MSRRVSVHHFVLTKLSRRHSPAQTAWDLLDVDYWRQVPGDTEFPRVYGQLDLFTRFYLDCAQPVEFRVHVWWEDHPGRQRRRIGQFGPFNVVFQSGEFVRDYAFRLHNVQFQGIGRHTVRLLRKRRGELASAGRWAVVAETHFTVERGP